MRALRYLPLAFLAGADGMALFLPYLLLVIAVVYLIRQSQARRLARASIPQVVPPHRVKLRWRLPVLTGAVSRA